MERSTNIVLAVILFLITTTLSFAGFRAAGARPKMVLQRRALEPPPASQPPPIAPVTPPAAEPAPSLEPAEEASPDRRQVEPDQTPPPVLPDSYRAADRFQPPSAPYNPAADPRHPLMDVSPLKKAAAPRKTRSTQPAAVLPGAPAVAGAPEPPLKPEGFCLVCGAPTDNWVEIDGRKQGYCPKHMSKVKTPVERATTTTSRRRPRAEGDGPPAPGEAIGADAAPEQSSPPRSFSAGEGELVQCRGVTKAGTQCRRKTRDPSGLCYQHRGQG